MIDALIFSKDRPAQLDLLLRSIDRHAPALYSSVQVRVRWTTPEYQTGYGICGREWAGRNPPFCLIPEGNFQEGFQLSLDRMGSVISFLVDDDIFYRDAAEPDELPWSYRGGDYDYPFSLDGNVYAKADIVKLLHGLRFNDPTELEHQGHLHRDRLPFTEVGHGEPCLVGVPLNRVSSSSGMPQMGIHEYDLNEQYLSGDRLTLRNFEGARSGLNLTHIMTFPGWESEVVSL